MSRMFLAPHPHPHTRIGSPVLTLSSLRTLDPHISGDANRASDLDPKRVTK
jgi:hypothetical protein